MSRALTLIAIAFVAYAVADVAHEALGHGGACLALGGRVLLLDTTFEDCSIKARLIDAAGPLMGLLAAAAAFLAARGARGNRRVFLALLFAFAAFWNLGYLILSGLMRRGDWHFVIAGLEPAGVWHIAIAGLGLALYIGAMRMLAAIWPAGDDRSPRAFSITAYAAATALAAAAGALDPRGTLFSDALPSALASIGLVLAKAPRAGLASSRGWIAAGLVTATAFVAVLGPGIR